MSAIGGRAENILLILRSFQFDPGCVKTCTSQECAELFSLSSSLSSGRKHFCFSNLRNRDGISTRRLNVGVFTRPRPNSDIGQSMTRRVEIGPGAPGYMAAIPCSLFRRSLLPERAKDKTIPCLSTGIDCE